MLTEVDWDWWAKFGPSTVIAICTAILTIATIALAIFNKKILDAHRNPHVIVTLELDHERKPFFSLYIKNIGNDLAKNVKFKFSDPLPLRCDSSAFDPDGNIIPMKEGIFVDGVPALAPNEVRELTWGLPWEVTKVLGDRTVYITCTFDKTGWGKKSICCPINFSSFKHHDASDKGLPQIHRDLEKLTKGVNNIAAAIKKIELDRKQDK